MLSSTDEVVISVSGTHAVICRPFERLDGSLRWECAANTDELEPAAIEAVSSSSQPFSFGVLYPCPSELAELAKWWT